MLVVPFVIINFGINLNLQMPNFPTIQKPYYRRFAGFSIASFVDALKLDKFTGVHFKRWQVKVTLSDC